MFLIQEKGGACIAITKSFILIGTFNTEKKMSNGVPQGPGEANKRVELLAKELLIICIYELSIYLCQY